VDPSHTLEQNVIPGAVSHKLVVHFPLFSMSSKSQSDTDDPESFSQTPCEPPRSAIESLGTVGRGPLMLQQVTRRATPALTSVGVENL